MKSVRSTYSKHSPLMNTNTARWIEKRQGKALHVEVDEKEQESFKILFNDLDYDKNGRIEFAELKGMMQAMRMNKLGLRELKEAFQKFDRDGSGTMSYDEFEDMMTYSKRPNATQEECHFTQVFTEMAVAYRRKKLETNIADESISGIDRFKDMLTLMSVNYVDGNENSDTARWKEAEKIYQAKALKLLDAQRSQTAVKGLRRPLKSSNSMPMLSPKSSKKQVNSVPPRDLVPIRQQVFTDTWGPLQHSPLQSESNKHAGRFQETYTEPSDRYKLTRGWSAQSRFDNAQIPPKMKITEGPYEFNRKAMNPPFTSKQDYSMADFNKEQSQRRRLQKIEPSLYSSHHKRGRAFAKDSTYAQATWWHQSVNNSQSTISPLDRSGTSQRSRASGRLTIGSSKKTLSSSRVRPPIQSLCRATEAPLKLCLMLECRAYHRRACNTLDAFEVCALFLVFMIFLSKQQAEKNGKGYKSIKLPMSTFQRTRPVTASY